MDGESRLLFGLLKICAYWCFMLRASSASIWGLMRQKENTENAPACCSLDLDIPTWSSIFSSPFRAFYWLFYMECPGFLVLLSGSNRGKCVYSSFPEAKVLLHDFYNSLPQLLIPVPQELGLSPSCGSASGQDGARGNRNI